jgi:hypothetical protein
VGSLDPVAPGDLAKDRRIGDGLPEALDVWIERERLTQFKVKLRGDDLAWELARMERVAGVVESTQGRLGIAEWFYSADFNEMCPNVECVLDFFGRLRERGPRAYAARPARQPREPHAPRGPAQAGRDR